MMNYIIRSTDLEIRLLILQGYRISSVIRQSFFRPKQSHRSRSISEDGSRSLGFFRKGKTCIILFIAKFHVTELDI